MRLRFILDVHLDCAIVTEEYIDAFSTRYVQELIESAFESLPVYGIGVYD